MKLPVIKDLRGPWDFFFQCVFAGFVTWIIVFNFDMSQWNPKADTGSLCGFFYLTCSCLPL